MKLKGKIVQIITEEKNKNYGIPKLNNIDWLNIRPAPEFKKSGYLIFLGLFILGFIISYILDKVGITTWLSLVIGVIPWLFGIYFLHRDSKKNEKIFPGGVWPFEAPFPIEKPHDFKVNDEIEINVEIKNAKS